MNASISRVTGPEAYDLIYQEHLSKLPDIDQETMQRSIMNSTELWILCTDDKIICIWGLVAPTFLSDRAYLWLYTTKHMKEHVFMFVRHSQRAMAEMLLKYPLIVGHAAISAQKSIRWLRWLGAVFSEPQGKFLPFEIRAKTWPTQLP